MENVVIKAMGLKCDYCDYRDMTVAREDYESRINSKCPECGENLLTYEDYQNVLRLEEAVRLTNLMSPEEIKNLTKGFSKDEVEEKKTWIADTHKGIKFTEIKDNEN